MSRQVWGFADAHSVLIGYVRFECVAHARGHAQDLADRRNEAIEYWLDDGNSERPSRVAHPASGRRP